MEPSIVEAARALVPLIRDQRGESDKQARLTREVVSACGQEGLFRMSAPREVGGLEATVADMVRATELVSGADPAVGWYIQNSQLGWRVAAQLGETERCEIFRNRDVNFGNGSQNQGRAVPVDGGYRLNGTWPVVTGVEDSEWCFLVGTLMEAGEPRTLDGHPDTRNFLVPTDALEITQTWHRVSAMRGTGSNLVRAQDVFVPWEHTVGADTPFAIDRAYTRVPTLCMIMPIIGGVVLGVLGPLVDTLAASLTGHTAAFTGEHRRDQAASQELIADCRAAYRALRAGLTSVAEEIDETLARGKDPSPALRAEAYAASMYAVDTCRKLASEIFAGGTRDAFMKDDPVERGLKDLHAIGYIMAAARFVLHSAGRVMLGGEHDPGV
jgi:alkylation response protein AidB-like acyl-CoA dehydrogenase